MTTLGEFIVSSDDKDHAYKLLGKRMAWALGYVPLLNVPVTLPDGTAGKAGTDLTDADVYGFRFDASGGVSRMLIDCKTTSGRAVDRVLWVRGLQDVLRLDELYLFKKKIPANARWLAHMLSVNCVDEPEMKALDDRLGLNRLKGPYFDGTGYARIEELLTFPKGSEYRSVVQFIQTGVWALKPAPRVITLLSLGGQKELRKKLRPDDPKHVCVVLGAARALAISLGMLISGLNVVDVLDVERRLREELHGGAESLAQKERFAAAISKLSGNGATDEALDHEGFPALLEEVNRLLVRRYALNDAIRVLDLALHYLAAGSSSLPKHLSGNQTTLSSKIASDILTLFVRANGLAPEFNRLILNAVAEGDDVAVGKESAPRAANANQGESGQQSLLEPLPPIDVK